MLVLARKLQQQIKIGDNIVITVVQMGKSVVRIGIDAPPDTKIIRKELLDGELTSQVDRQEVAGNGHSA